MYTDYPVLLSECLVFITLSFSESICNFFLSSIHSATLSSKEMGHPTSSDHLMIKTIFVFQTKSLAIIYFAAAGGVTYLYISYSFRLSPLFLSLFNSIFLISPLVLLSMDVHTFLFPPSFINVFSQNRSFICFFSFYLSKYILDFSPNFFLSKTHLFLYLSFA